MTHSPVDVESEKIPLAVGKELRGHAHEVCNAIETIMQTAYLLKQSNLDESRAKWVETIEAAAHQAAISNRALRQMLHEKSR